MAQNITNLLYADWIKPHRKKIVFLFLFIVFLIVGYYAYIWYATPLFGQENFDQDIANRNTRDGEVHIHFFYANWCPHCKKAHPEWNQFKTAVDGTTVKNRVIRCVDVDCTEGNDPRIQKYSVKGYPTVVIEKDAKTIHLDSKITKGTLDKFINEML